MKFSIYLNRRVFLLLFFFFCLFFFFFFFVVVAFFFFLQWTVPFRFAPTSVETISWDWIQFQEM